MNSHTAQQNRPVLVAHIVFRFDYGGLENGLVNIINRLSGPSLRHVVIALTESTRFQDRLEGDVDVISLHKRPGQDPGTYWRLFRLLRNLRPDIVHTRNFGTLDCALVAYLAGVPARIHGEHGWDVTDPDGTRRKYRIFRRVLLKVVDRVVTVSRDLEQWLVNTVGVKASKIRQIHNGVDTDRFSPRGTATDEGDDLVVGSVTRFAEIKDPLNLVKAYVELHKQGQALKLLMIGDGPLAATAADMLQAEGIDSTDALPGFLDDIPELLRDMDLFVLGSRREGISNTVLEAMASGLPVIATDTGGNKELVIHEKTGLLVPPEDSRALAEAIRFYVRDRDRIVEHGKAARHRAVSDFSIQSMAERYGQLYDELVNVKGL